jgi:hypothetical protein
MKGTLDNGGHMEQSTPYARYKGHNKCVSGGLTSSANLTHVGMRFACLCERACCFQQSFNRSSIEFSIKYAIRPSEKSLLMLCAIFLSHVPHQQPFLQCFFCCTWWNVRANAHVSRKAPLQAHVIIIWTHMSKTLRTWRGRSGCLVRNAGQPISQSSHSKPMALTLRSFADAGPRLCPPPACCSYRCSSAFVAHSGMLCPPRLLLIPNSRRRRFLPNAAAQARSQRAGRILRKVSAARPRRRAHLACERWASSLPAASNGSCPHGHRRSPASLCLRRTHCPCTCLPRLSAYCTRRLLGGTLVQLRYSSGSPKGPCCPSPAGRSTSASSGSRSSSSNLERYAGLCKRSCKKAKNKRGKREYVQCWQLGNIATARTSNTP